MFSLLFNGLQQFYGPPDTLQPFCQILYDWSLLGKVKHVTTSLRAGVYTVSSHKHIFLQLHTIYLIYISDAPDSPDFYEMPDSIPECAQSSDEESTTSSISTCDYSDTDMESACSDCETHTTDRYIIVSCYLMKDRECS